MNESRMTHKYFLYGPPGSGKSSLGKMLAASLGESFIDLDDFIVEQAGKSISEIFSNGGERSFREIERDALIKVLSGNHVVVALGGGALLNEHNRVMADNAGQVLCLSASDEVLWARLHGNAIIRPLLSDSSVQNEQTVDHTNQVLDSDHEYHRLLELLKQRAEHYASFEYQLDTSYSSFDELVWQAQILFGTYRITGMGEPYPVRIVKGGISYLGHWLKTLGLKGPIGLVSDLNVAKLYAEIVTSNLEFAGYQVNRIVIPAGEEHKNITTIQRIWSEFLTARLERSSTIVALGGGVVGDLAGFAAATFLRGIRWVAVPTTLLAMVDASLGGKTGADLPQGKNLIGAFYPPDLVLADPEVLASLPKPEMRSGLAEVVKHGIIGDPALFEICKQGWITVNNSLDEVVRRAMAVKVKVVSEDPYEQNRRAVLNLGHTLGHAIELASNYQLRHGECVAIGMIAATKMSIRCGFADFELLTRIERTLLGLGLPVSIPDDVPLDTILNGIMVDKKKKSGQVRLVLPVAIGDVKIDYAIDRVEELFDVMAPDGGFP